MFKLFISATFCVVHLNVGTEPEIHAQCFWHYIHLWLNIQISCGPLNAMFLDPWKNPASKFGCTVVVLILALLWFSSVTWSCFDCFVSVLNSVSFISSNFWDVKCVSSLWPGNQETVLYLHISTSFTSWWDYSCCSFVPADFLLRLVLVISLCGDFLVVKSKNWSHNPFNRNQPNWVY